MFKLFLFVAFLAFAAAAPGNLLAPVLPYSAPLYTSGIAHAPAPYAYSAYSAPLTYGYGPYAQYPYKQAYYTF